MKKIFAFCVSIVSLLAFLLPCALPASALQLSDRADYDLQLNNGTYLKFDEGSLIGGTYRETSQSYAYTLVTVQDATSVDALKEVLGEDLNYPTGTSVGGTYTVKENQYVFSYDDSMDYESLYDIAGVEKVEFAKWDYVGGFIRAMLIDDNDTWVTDNNIDTSTLLMATVYTEKDVEITAEMFEAVGCPVRHVYMYSEAVIEEGETEWRVYCDLEDLNSYLVFDDAIQQVKTQTEGVVSGGIDFGFTVTGEENFTLDALTPSAIASEPIYGDVNLDGAVDICDAVILQQHLADVVTLSEAQTTNGDCNGDGVITAEDSASLLRFLLCITDTLPET